jgi:thioesterase domain-containing protein
LVSEVQACVDFTELYLISRFFSVSVAFIGLVDSYLISENAGAYSHDPLEELARLFGGVLADAFVGLDGAEQSDIRARFSTLSLDEKIREALALGRQRGLLSADLPIEPARRQIELVNAHQRLLREHRPRAVRGSLFLWWSLERADGAAPRTDWELYTTGRTQSEMTGGNHFTCLRPPNVQGLAERIRKRITEIEGPTSSGAAIE